MARSVGRLGPIDILCVCTANLCRSPMAAALLGRRLEDLGVVASVTSAGLLTGGSPSPPAGVEAMASLGLDTSAHRSHRLEVADLVRADLVVGMAREHVREVVVTLASAWPRTFTLKELVRRAGEAGPRPAGQEVGDWVAKLHAGRHRGDLLGSSEDDDVADPVGGTAADFETTARELDDLVTRLVTLGWSGTLGGWSGALGGRTGEDGRR